MKQQSLYSYLRPLSIAKSRQFRPVWSVSVMSAPLDSNRETTSGCPSLAAKCNGVVCKNKDKFSYKRDKVQRSLVKTCQIESKLQNVTSLALDLRTKRLALLSLLEVVKPSPDRKMVKLLTSDNLFPPLRVSR